MDQTKTTSQQVDQYYSEQFLAATIPADAEATWVKSLSDIATLPDASVAYVVLDRTLNRTIDYMALMAEAYRVLKPGGILVMTVTALSVSATEKEWYWGFTGAAGEFIVSKFFPREHISMKTYGNVLSGRFLIQGKPAPELSPRELNFTDERLPIVTGIRAEKH